MTGVLDAHPLFSRIEDGELARDVVYEAILNKTEEGHKAKREGRGKQIAAYLRIAG